MLGLTQEYGLTRKTAHDTRATGLLLVISPLARYLWNTIVHSEHLYRRRLVAVAGMRPLSLGR